MYTKERSFQTTGFLTECPYQSCPHEGEFWKVFLPIATLKRSCYFLYIFNKVIYICNQDATVFKDFSGDGRLFCQEDREPGVDVPNLQVEQTFQMFCFCWRSRVTVVVMKQFDEIRTLIGSQY